ncbi:hypothetical protein HALLA_20845 (plasmid) [Halostagnicola larsenii XH-48]|uniref:Uncharacterized protein n=1 Tax=Halostagnicola larsenii XH-48 TaxID=797299 RepID=W0JUY9_9EURY|nr:hypothetical protein HALLA_20845 [Halostagnicola larsenii XH-48]
MFRLPYRELRNRKILGWIERFERYSSERIGRRESSSD